MLYKLIYIFHTDISWLNVFRYITFRTILSILTSFLFCFVFGDWIIDKLRSLQMRQFVRDDGPPNHKAKQGTPTMGGCMFLPAVFLSIFLWVDWGNFYVLSMAFVIFSFAVIGFLDDWLKIKRQNSKGLRASVKFSLQIVCSLLVAVVLYLHHGFDSRLVLPFFKEIRPDLGLGYILLMVFVITGSSNAVNLTDGLDGLATGPLIVAFACYMALSYFAGHRIISSYLHIPYISGAGEICVVCGALVGAGLGFLWYNAYPAEIFMGDTGSLSLGAALGMAAVITKQEILLVIVGGLFVFETLSVIIQVGYFKFTNGKRVFRMAPIHHHFELKGWPEPKVIVRFWIVAILLALCAVSTLKLR
ncbi:MAG: phospho-N-acetylmuramoyl-pentapeptide-transferase [Deltaproteobacteria bacterium]|nr:phospho-N-acetylmuramoyl-pentapeptide-transferase [Deltaproteobacteria bacterium]